MSGGESKSWLELESDPGMLQIYFHLHIETLKKI